MLCAADAQMSAEIPARLTLREEPNANVHRYDHLREASHAAEAMVATLRSLKLHGMAQAVANLAQQQGPALQPAQPILHDLLKAEVAKREVRTVNYQLKTARFPAYRDLAGLRFKNSSIQVPRRSRKSGKPQQP